MKISLIKKVVLSVNILLAVFVSFSGTAFAESANLVSGPAGTMVNGWYTSHPTVKVQAVCNGALYGNVFDMDIAGWSWSGGGNPSQAQPGRHYIELLSNDNSNMYVNNDGALSSYLAGGCSNPDGSNPTHVLWQGYIQWDNTSPTVSIASPSSNANTDASSIQISGPVGDSGSGIESVTVNGIRATVQGNTFDATIPLNIGLNSINATATSNSGQSTQSSTVVVFRYEIASSANVNGPRSTSQSPSAQQGSSSQSSAAGTSNTPNASKSSKTMPPVMPTAAQSVSKSSDKASTSTAVAAGVAAVGGAGLGIVSWLGYVPYKKMGLFIIKLIGK